MTSSSTADLEPLVAFRPDGTEVTTSAYAELCSPPDEDPEPLEGTHPIDGFLFTSAQDAVKHLNDFTKIRGYAVRIQRASNYRVERGVRQLSEPGRYDSLLAPAGIW